MKKQKKIKADPYVIAEALSLLIYEFLKGIEENWKCLINYDLQKDEIIAKIEKSNEPEACNGCGEDHDPENCQRL